MLRSVAQLSSLLVTYTEEDGKYLAGASRSATPSPLFSPTTTEYTVKVPHKCTKVDVLAFAPKPIYITPLPEKAKSMGKGSVKVEGKCDGLCVGKNVVKITVTSDDGKDTQVYTLKVVRRRSPLFYLASRTAIVLFPLLAFAGPVAEKLKDYRCCGKDKGGKDGAAGKGDAKAAAPAAAAA